MRARARLARWLSVRAMLTWRSIVNRVWHFIGRGLVNTRAISGGWGLWHPELLDWLAAGF
jgi:hypothetical protein